MKKLASYIVVALVMVSYLLICLIDMFTGKEGE